MKSTLTGIISAIVVFFLVQTVMPFPIGLVLGIGFAAAIIWYTKKHVPRGKDSLLNYRRVDPINEYEREQNDEALRILEKKYIEEKISKEEYLKMKKEFESIQEAFQWFLENVYPSLKTEEKSKVKDAKYDFYNGCIGNKNFKMPFVIIFLKNNSIKVYL